MLKMKIKTLILAVGCAAVLSGCTERTILENNTPMEPDFNLYANIELDDEQIQDDMESIWLDEGDYPMGVALEFERHEEDAYLDMTIVVKDGTSGEDLAEYVDELIKGFNDEVAMQDFNFGESGENTFGGYFQDREIHLKIYEQSAYEAGGEPMYEPEVPMDTYMEFEFK